MKNSIQIFLLTIFFAISVLAQSVQVQKATEGNDVQSYAIDARPFLEETEKEVTEYLKENPNYFEEQKLQKTTAWNFTVGTTKEWHARDSGENQWYKVASTCRAVGINCYIFVEDAIWGTHANQVAVDGIKNAFDSSTPANGSKGIFQIDTETFGSPPDIDADAKIVILILDIQDGYTGSGGYIAGYFHSVNEVPGDNSNMAEMYYLDANPSDLLTESGLNNVMGTTAHEFQHMIHFNYHNGSPDKPSQSTFMDEACSEVASVVCGYGIRRQTLFNSDYNQYLEEWRDGDDVLKDYTRASRYMTYMYDQFGTDFLGKFVQSTSTSISAVNDALSKLSTSTALRFNESIENWFMANVLNDKTINPTWGYTTPGIGTINPLDHSNPNFSSSTIKVANLGADYISFSRGKNLTINFNDFGSGILKFKALKYKADNSIDIEDISAGTEHTFSDFGTTYNKITFAVLNTNASFKRNYKYTSTGDVSGGLELAYDIGKPSGVLPLANNDTVSVVFDGVPGGTLDSIRIALRQAGSIHGGIYEFTGSSRPTPLGKALVPNLTVTSNIAVRPPWDDVAKSYPVPFPNWITVDLTSNNIDVSKPFVAAFVVEGSYVAPNYAQRIMISEQPDDAENRHSYSYFTPSGDGERDWYFITASAGNIYAYLIRAYVNLGATDVEKQSDVIPSEFSLQQNYPNPFNPTTDIQYAIPSESYVSIVVFDVLGKEVATIVNERQSAGSYKADFNASNLPSGIYLYRINAGNFSETKKMMLIK